MTLIEVNPFDPEKGLGHTSSLALFWEADQEQIKGNGGKELEIRVMELQSDASLERECNGRLWPTVGLAAREALRAAFQELTAEELEASHAVTRAIARKFGLRRTSVPPAGKGKDKGASILPPNFAPKGNSKGKTATASELATADG